jgi:hypothetical protein
MSVGEVTSNRTIVNPEGVFSKIEDIYFKIINEIFLINIR